MCGQTTRISLFNIVLLKNLSNISSARESLGFNMLEMLIMLMVTGIVSAVGTLTWNNGREQAIASSAVSTVRSVIQEGRFQAIRQNSAVAVYLSGDDTIVIETDGCNNDVDSIIRETEIDNSSADISIDWNNTGGVVWQPNGLAETCNGGLPAQTIQVLLDGQTEESLTIAGVAGRVRVQ